MTTLIGWLMLFVVSVLFELTSPGLFFFLALSGGALAAALISFTGIGLWGECIVFACLAAVSFFLLMRYVKTTSKNTLHQTNVYALTGKKGIVTESISDCKRGWVKIEGELWSAAPVHAGIIEEGAVVEVVSSMGSHVVVKKIEGHHC